MISLFQPSPSDPFSPSKVFTFLFVMIGPLKVIGPFAKMTAGWDRGLKRRLAFQAIAIAAIGAFVAATLGSRLLQKWGISLGALLLTTGIVLFLVAMQVVMQQYATHEQAESAAHPSAIASPPSPAALAFSPLAFPTIITPYGAALLILLASMRSGQTTALLGIAGIAALVLALDVVAMLTADPHPDDARGPPHAGHSRQCPVRSTGRVRRAGHRRRPAPPRRTCADLRLSTGRGAVLPQRYGPGASKTKVR